VRLKNATYGIVLKKQNKTNRERKKKSYKKTQTKKKKEKNWGWFWPSHLRVAESPLILFFLPHRHFWEFRWLKVTTTYVTDILYKKMKKLNGMANMS